MIGQRRSRGLRNECNRRNGPNIKPADVAFTAHIKPAKRRDFLARVTGGMRGAEVEAQNIAAFVDGMEVLHVHDIGDRVDVAAQPGKSNRVIKTPAMGCVDRAVGAVVADRGRDGAGDDAVQRARSGQAPELQGLE